MASSTYYEMPTTMKGPPICMLVPPGKCQIGQEAVKLPLLKKFPVSPTSFVLRFGLPKTDEPLHLSTTACLLCRATIDGEEIQRKYTPISTQKDIGYVDLLVKNYGAPGKMSRLMCEELVPGKDTLDFMHTPKQVKLQAPFAGNAILMIAGGTGIAPMMQALHAILGADDDKNNTQQQKQKVTLLYGSRESNDILGKQLLQQWADDYPDQFTYVDIISHDPKDSDWKGLRGFIDEALVQKYFPYDPKDASMSLQAFVCGPPPMYEAICGPKKFRDNITGVLGNLGFTTEQVTKF